MPYTPEKQKKHYQDNKEQYYWRNVRNRYGLSQEDFNDILEDQNSSCALCSTPFESLRKPHLCIDHCHETNKIRGLLCMKCNVGLGMLGDTVNSLGRALAYVKES